MRIITHDDGRCLTLRLLGELDHAAAQEVMSGILRQTGGALALCGVPRQVRRVLDVAGLTNIVPVLEDRAKECEQC